MLHRVSLVAFGRLALQLALPLALLFASTTASAAPPLQDESQTNEEAFRANLEHRISRHPYFKRIKLDWVWDHNDFVILVQRPATPSDEYTKRVARLHSSTSQKMNKHFAEGIAHEYGVSLRETSPRMVIAVLATYRDFDNYSQLILRKEPRGRVSSYNPGDRMFVTCESPFRGTSNIAKNHRALDRMDRAQQIVQAYSTSTLGPPEPHWLFRALCLEACELNNRDTAKQGLGKASEWSYHQVSELIQDPAKRVTLLHSLPEFFRFRSWQEVSRASNARALASGVKAPSAFTADQAFNFQAGALFQYLAIYSDDDMQARMRTFAESAMKGRLKQKPFERVFEDVDWARVEADFWRHVWKRHAEESTDEKLDELQLKAFLNERKGLEADALATKETVESIDLIERLTTSDQRLALAIAAVRLGDVERADAILSESLSGVSLTDDQRKRFEREQVRVRAWLSLRNRYFEQLISSGKKLSIDFEGKRLLAAVTAIQAGELTLASNNRNLKTLAIKRLDALQLARKMAEKRSNFEVDWSIAYPFVIEPDLSAARWLKGDEPERQQLAEDEGSDYVARAPWIDAAACVLVLGGDPPSEGERIVNPKLVDERLALIVSLWKQREALPEITDFRAGLISLAEVEYASRFDNLELEDLVAGQIEELRDGRVRLRYDFEDRLQIIDWPLDAEPGFHQHWSPSQVPFSLDIEGGQLSGVGQGSRSHVLGFEGPQSMIWKERIPLEEDVTNDKLLLFRFGLCTVLGKETFAGAKNSVELIVRDADKRELASKAPKNDQMAYQSTYVVELVHDGESTLTLKRKNAEISSIPVGSRLSGRPQLWLHTDYRVIIDELEIVGRVTEASMRELRKLRVSEQVRQLGLAD